MPKDYQTERLAMVRDLEASGVGDPRVLRAMERVPRHLFVQEAMRPFAYENRPLPIGFEQTISQPYIVAHMLSALNLDGTERVLEVGTGSGYQTALLALLARRVHSVEVIPTLEANARRLLDELGFRNVTVELANGSLGLPEHAPFDAIVCAAAAPKIPAPLIEQLAEGGRLVIPVGEGRVQALMLVEKTDRETTVRHLGGCVFVPLIGEAAWPNFSASSSTR